MGHGHVIYMLQPGLALQAAGLHMPTKAVGLVACVIRALSVAVHGSILPGRAPAESFILHERDALGRNRVHSRSHRHH